MIIWVINKIKAIIKYLFGCNPLNDHEKIDKYIQNGRIPWSIGYNEYKWKEIEKSISDYDLIKSFKEAKYFCNYGMGIDERIVEYPWIIANLSKAPCKLLDAGSTFNYRIILDNKIVSQKEKIILTYYPESQNFNERRISYLYCDLRNIPIRDNYFDEIVCQSTLEHIDMNNSIYGYELEYNLRSSEKSSEYIFAINELLRVLKSCGRLLITVPYGCFENHGFFQQFDLDMISQLIKTLKPHGLLFEEYFKYNDNGWELSNKGECKNALSFNPHTGVGRGVDNAAHSRAICCLKFVKN